MNERTTTYNYKGQLEATMVRLQKDSGLLPETRSDILGFHRSIVTEGLSLPRQVKYAGTLRLIFSGSRKPARQWTREDIDEFVMKVETGNYSAWTRRDYRVVLRRFYRWLRGTDEYPPEVRRLKVSVSQSDSKLPEEMVSEEEVGRMISASRTPRDAAFLACLYETGCRPDELGSLRIKHVQPDQYGFVLVVRGKTGMRRTRVCLFAHQLAAWLEKHPRRDDPNAALWCSKKNSDFQTPLSNHSINNNIKRVASDVGVRKRVYPYLFRHSRATSFATKLTEAQMNVVFGWMQGSRMPRTYVHLSGRDVDGTLLRLAGVSGGEELQKESVLKPRTCFRCSTSNPGISKYCNKCSAPMDADEVFKAENNTMAAGQLITELIKDDETLQALLKERIKKKLAAEQLCAPGQNAG
jgi:integrase/recombinase XerD